MVSAWPPPFIRPRICDLLNVPSTVTGMPRLMCPSPVVASMLAWKSDGSTMSTLPSPVRIVQLEAILEPGRTRVSTLPSPVLTFSASKRPAIRIWPSPESASTFPSISRASMDPSPVRSRMSPFRPSTVMLPSFVCRSMVPLRELAFTDPSPVCTFTLPLREETSTAPSPVSTCRSPSRGMRTSMCRFLELWPQPKLQRLVTRATSSTLSPSCRESTLRFLPNSYPRYSTRNSTCLPSLELTRTLPSLVSIRTLALPDTAKDFTTSSAPARGATAATAKRAALAIPSRMATVGWVSSFMGKSPPQFSVLPSDTTARDKRFRSRGLPGRGLGSNPLCRALLLAPRTGRPRLGPEGSQEFRGGQRIDDILLLEPAAPRHGNAIADEGEVASAVRIGRDDHLHATVLAHTEIDVLQVETVGIGVALHRHAVFHASRQYFFHVVVEGIPAQKEPPGGMRDDLRVGVFDGGQHALAHGGAVEIEVRVDRADHHIEFGKDFVGIVQRPFLQDVHFRPGEYTNPQILLVSGVDFLDVSRNPFFVQSIRHGDGFRMVGDGNVVVTELPGRFGHFFDRILAVARRGVHLQVALHILEGDQFRKFVVFGGGDFAGVFAQFRRNEIELQFRIDFFLRPAREELFAFQRGQRVFVERVAHLVGATAQRHVVLFRTGKVQKRRAKIFLFEHSNVDLQAVSQRKADFVFAVRQRLVDPGKFQDVLGEGVDLLLRGMPVGQCHQQIEVADGFFPSAQRRSEERRVGKEC